MDTWDGVEEGVSAKCVLGASRVSGRSFRLALSLFKPHLLLNFCSLTMLMSREGSTIIFTRSSVMKD